MHFFPFLFYVYKRVRLDVTKFSFSNRAVNEWNILDEEIILGYSLARLK